VFSLWSVPWLYISDNKAACVSGGNIKLQQVMGPETQPNWPRILQEVFGTDLGEHLSNSRHDGKFRLLHPTPNISFLLHDKLNQAYSDITHPFHL
jgi:hypothetical protein